MTEDPAVDQVARLVAALDVRPLADNTFEGRDIDAGRRRIFGGLVVAQALVAAARTVVDRTPHALHGFFMRPGDPALPIRYEVTALRDGRSFATRHCAALQHDVPIFTATVSFQTDEAGLEHQIAMPDVPLPDMLPSVAELLRRFGALMPPATRRYLEASHPIELRPTDLARFGKASGVGSAAATRIWMRAAAPLPDDAAVHWAVLAYLSDMTLLDTALLAHGRSVFDAEVQAASLDHALWFHRPFRADAWLLYSQDSPSAAGGRGLARGSIFTEDGRLVASVAQEGLIRLRPHR